MAPDLEAAIARRIDELLAELDEIAPVTDEDCRRAAAIFASARPISRLRAAG